MKSRLAKKWARSPRITGPRKRRAVWRLVVLACRHERTACGILPVASVGYSWLMRDTTPSPGMRLDDLPLRVIGANNCGLLIVRRVPWRAA